MREEQAIEILKKHEAQGATLRIAGYGDFRVIKRLLSKCLEAEIPAMLGPCKVKGWGTEGTLLVEEHDMQRVVELQNDEWRDQIALEGLPPIDIDASTDATDP